MVQNREPTDFTDLVSQVIYLFVSPQFEDLLKCSIMDVHIANKYFYSYFKKRCILLEYCKLISVFQDRNALWVELTFSIATQIIIILFLVHSI